MLIIKMLLATFKYRVAISLHNAPPPDASDFAKPAQVIDRKRLE